jgi:hypothetical protein
VESLFKNTDNPINPMEKTTCRYGAIYPQLSTPKTEENPPVEKET